MTEIKFWISEEDFPDDWEEEGIDVVALAEAVKNLDCDITVVPAIGSHINIIVLDCWLEFGVKDYTYYFSDRRNDLWSEEASGRQPGGRTCAACRKNHKTQWKENFYLTPTTIPPAHCVPRSWICSTWYGNTTSASSPSASFSTSPPSWASATAR